MAFYDYSQRPLVRTPGVDNLAPVPKFQLPMFSWIGPGLANLFSWRYIEGAIPARPFQQAGVTGYPGTPAGPAPTVSPLSPQDAYGQYLDVAGGDFT